MDIHCSIYILRARKRKIMIKEKHPYKLACPSAVPLSGTKAGECKDVFLGGWVHI